MVLGLGGALPRFAVLIRQRCLTGVWFALVIAASPEIAVFALEAAQTPVVAVGTGEGLCRPGERLNRAISGEYGQLRIQRPVVVCNHRTVARLAVGDVVEVVFHATGVGDFEEVETAAQRLNQRGAEFRRHKLPFDHFNVAALLNRADDAGVSGWSADAFALQRADERGLAVTRGWFGFEVENLAVLRDVLCADSQLWQRIRR